MLRRWLPRLELPVELVLHEWEDQFTWAIVFALELNQNRIAQAEITYQEICEWPQDSWARELTYVKHVGDLIFRMVEDTRPKWEPYLKPPPRPELLA